MVGLQYLERDSRWCRCRVLSWCCSCRSASFFFKCYSSTYESCNMKFLGWRWATSAGQLSGHTHTRWKTTSWSREQRSTTEELCECPTGFFLPPHTHFPVKNMASTPAKLKTGSSCMVAFYWSGLGRAVDTPTDALRFFPSSSKLNHFSFGMTKASIISRLVSNAHTAAHYCPTSNPVNSPSVFYIESHYNRLFPR